MMQRGRINLFVPIIVLALSLWTACEPVVQPARAVRTRASRFGVLRDLVLFRRSPAQGGSFFLDRFETTQADWERYLETEDRDGSLRVKFDAWQASFDPSLPVAGVDLYEARRYARWRFARLPRLDEWRWAATVGGKYRFPWGDRDSEGRANAAALRLPGLTPVGAFESGRQGDRPYDLLGNVSEWTETIDLDWSYYSPEVKRQYSWLNQFVDGMRACETPDEVFEELVVQVGRPSFRLRLELELNLAEGEAGFFDRSLTALWHLLYPDNDEVTTELPRASTVVSGAQEPNMLVAREVLARTPAFAVWHDRRLPVPLAWWLAADGMGRFSYVYVGRMGQPISAGGANVADPQVGSCHASERSSRRGLRLAADPVLLLDRLLQESGDLDAESLALVRGFLRQHREVLIPAVRTLSAFRTATGPIADAMREEFTR